MCVLGPRIYLFCLACICWDQCYAVGSKSKITRTRRGASSCYNIIEIDLIFFTITRRPEPSGAET